MFAGVVVLSIVTTGIHDRGSGAQSRPSDELTMSITSTTEAPRSAAPPATEASPRPFPPPATVATATPAVAPSTTVPQPTPAPVAAPAPAPEPSPPLPPSPAASRTSEEELALIRMLEASLDAVIPPAWRSLYPRNYSVSGDVPTTLDSGGLLIPAAVVSGSWDHLRVVVAHEWGHLLSARYGTGGFGAPPAGFPAATSNPAEEWADCVSAVLTGIIDPSHGLPPCSAAGLDWTAGFIAVGPA